MTKQLREGMWLYIAPKIKGTIINGLPRVYDERNKKNLNPQNIDDKIEIFERQVNGWFLGVASSLKIWGNAGFVILNIGVSYIEGIQQNIEGKISRNGSKSCFIRGLKRIFNLQEPDTLLKAFYEQVRCGIFHDGMTRGKVIISSKFSMVIDFSDQDIIKINHIKFIDIIRNDFSNYISKLRNLNDTDSRKKFDNTFTNITSR